MLRDAAGTPIQGASVHLLRDGGPVLKPAQFPVYDWTGEPLLSDQHGVVTLRQVVLPPQFGGHKWRPYWLFTWEISRPPTYSIRVEKPGFAPITIPFWKLYAGRFDESEVVQLVVGKRAVELRVSYYDVVLQ